MCTGVSAFLSIVVWIPPVSAAPYTTPCTGVRWSMEDLKANSSAVGPGMFPGTYAVLDDITVCAGDILVLRPGEQVWVHKHKRVSIEGILDANGTIGNNIAIASYNVSDLWGGFILEPGSAGYFANCTIFGGLMGVFGRASQVSIEGCSLSLGGTGIQLADHSTATLNNVTAVGGLDWGIVVNASSVVAAELNVVANHKSGIYVSNGSVFSGTGVNVWDNGGGGLTAGNSTLSLRDSNVSNNMYANIVIFDSEVDLVKASVLNTYTGMYVDGSTLTIENSSVGDSDFGMRIDSSNVIIGNSSLRDFESVYPPLAFDCSDSDINIKDSRLIRAPITTYSRCSLTIERSYLEDGLVKVAGTSLFVGNEFVNYTVQFGTFTQVRGNAFRDCDVALESIALTTSIYEIPVHLDRNTISRCRVGLRTGMGDQLVIFANGTFESVMESVADATNGGTFFIVNSSIGSGGFRGGADRIYLARYLTVRTLKVDGTPLAGADIHVSFRGRIVRANRTGNDGTLAWIPAPYAVYGGDGADPALKVGESVVSATAPGTKFTNSPRNVNMTEERMEIFQAEKSEETFDSLSTITTIIVIVLIFAIILIVLATVVIRLRRRKREPSEPF